MILDEDNLPLGWVWAKIDDTGDYLNGFAFKPSDWGNVGKPIIRIQNLTAPEKPFNLTTREVDFKYFVRKGDLLVSWSATLDAFIWNREEALLNQHIFKVIVNQNLVEKKFLFHLLRSAIDEMKRSEHLHGSTMKHINREPFLSHKVLVPPLNEQRRIVAKIEALKARSQQVKEALEAIPPLLDQFRQSVLAAAFRGDLTADWRQKNSDVEPASDLLERIRAERRHRWEEAELEKMKAGGKTPKDDKWKSKYKDPELIDLEELLEIPGHVMDL